MLLPQQRNLELGRHRWLHLTSGHCALVMWANDCQNVFSDSEGSCVLFELFPSYYVPHDAQSSWGLGSIFSLPGPGLEGVIGLRSPHCVPLYLNRPWAQCVSSGWRGILSNPIWGVTSTNLLSYPSGGRLSTRASPLLLQRLKVTAQRRVIYLSILCIMIYIIPIRLIVESCEGDTSRSRTGQNPLKLTVTAG